MAEKEKGKKCNCALVAGLALLGLGLFADTLGLGASPEFGYKQIIACIVGILLIISGLSKPKGCCSGPDKNKCA